MIAILLIILALIVYLYYNKPKTLQFGGAESENKELTQENSEVPTQEDDEVNEANIEVSDSAPQQPAVKASPPPPVEVPQQNSQSVDPNTVIVVSPIGNNSLINGWSFETTGAGVVTLCTFKKTGNEIYTITGETSFQATSAGTWQIKLSGLSQIPAQSGDYYGFRCSGKNIVRVTDSSDTLTTISNSTKILGVGSTLDNTQQVRGKKYYVVPSTIGLYMAPKNNNPGSQLNPAVSAQEIVDFYKKYSMGAPNNGVYWIRHVGAKKPDEAMQIYCNFTLRPGRGYMLVGAAGVGNTWPNFDSGKYPFSPSFGFGKYDKFGRAGTYYLNWSKLDSAALADDNPDKCKKGGFFYNAEGKFCGNKDGTRLKVNGSLTEVMLATANNEYWVVLNRDTLNSGKNQTIVPVASSGNFKGECEPNKSVFMKVVGDDKSSSVGTGEPWINMGNTYACGDNYMFWGEDDFQANENFKNKNGGIMIYVGGSYVPDKQKFRFNPTTHMAPGRAPGRSTYKEAENVCKSLGKKVCSVNQLELAQRDGFGSASCGWTSTGPDPYHLNTMQPVSVDIWAKGDTLDCPLQKITKGRSDIICCDNSEFIDFEHLDVRFKQGKMWLIKLEQAFEKRYGSKIPSRTKLIVYGEKVGLAVFKQNDSSYILVSHQKAKSPKNWPDNIKYRPFCQVETKPNNRVRATFLTTLADFDIKKGTHWDGDGREMINYGSRVKFFNDTNKEYLVATDTPYPHLPEKKFPQVVGYASVTSNIWKIDPVDSKKQGGVKSGDVVYLLNPKTGGRLAGNLAMDPVPGSDPLHVLATIYTENYNLTDCQWKVQAIGTKFWYSDSEIRLMHVNTGKLLELTGAKHKTKSIGGNLVSTVAIATDYDHRSAWSTIIVENKKGTNQYHKCMVYLNQLARARELTKTDGPDRIYALRKAEQLLQQFDRDCYDIPKQAYNKTIWALAEEIRKQVKLLNTETGIYNNYHRKEVELMNNIKNQEKLMKQKETELKKLRAKACKPVRKCVDKVYETAKISRKCSGLDPLLDGSEISDELLKKIKELKMEEVSVNDFDIRSHSGVTKYVKNTDIRDCVAP
jgi:hypothetical protein